MFARKLTGFVATAAIVAGFVFTAQAGGESEVTSPTVSVPTEIGVQSKHTGPEAVEPMPEERDLKGAVGETLTTFRAGLLELARSLTDF